MIKHLRDLQVGDRVIRNEDGRVYTLKQIISDEEEETLYCFYGFVVNESVMTKLFKSSDKIYVKIYSGDKNEFSH